MPVSTKPKKINRNTFYNRIRSTVFTGKLSQLQVDGIEVIINEWESRMLQDIRWLAYILGTTYHESAHTMQPIAEYGRGKGRLYGIADTDTGQVYYGRGFCQITWKDNYRTFANLLGVDLVRHPDLAMDCKIATDILFEGMLKGLFTGRKLPDYFNEKKADWVGARRIINGLDRAQVIAEYAKQFHSSLITHNS